MTVFAKNPLLLTALAVLLLGSSALPTKPVLTGSIYLRDGNTGQAKAVVGAIVYVRIARTTSTEWLSPIITDPYGRFAFYGLSSGTYLMRIYGADHVRLREQLTTVPSALPPIVVEDLVVVYYPKNADGATVDKALQALPYPYTQRESVNQLATNTIWFGNSVAISDVKQIASALLSNGVQIRAIRRFADGSGLKAHLIEIGSSPQHVSGPVLTMASVQRAKQFPTQQLRP